MYAEHAVAKEKHKVNHDGLTKAQHFTTTSIFRFYLQYTKEGHKEDKLVEMQKHLKKQARKVGKLEEEIEKRIFTHNEL